MLVPVLDRCCYHVAFCLCFRALVFHLPDLDLAFVLFSDFLPASPSSKIFVFLFNKLTELFCRPLLLSVFGSCPCVPGYGRDKLPLYSSFICKKPEHEPEWN